MPATPPELVVVTADHPSLDPAVEVFASALRAESRYFGRRGDEAARPVPSLVRRLTSPGHDHCDLRVAGLIDGEIVAMAAIDEQAPEGPELLIAVAAPWRRRGLALAVGQELVRRATQRGLERIVLRTSRRSSDVHEAGLALGLELVELGPGRQALVRQLERQPV